LRVIVAAAAVAWRAGEASSRLWRTTFVGERLAGARPGVSRHPTMVSRQELAASLPVRQSVADGALTDVHCRIVVADAHRRPYSAAGAEPLHSRPAT